MIDLAMKALSAQRSDIYLTQIRVLIVSPCLLHWCCFCRVGLWHAPQPVLCSACSVETGPGEMSILL